MKTVKLTIEYVGTRYAGWQVQQKAPSIQQHLEEALEEIVGETTRLISSGRTDAGVHAAGMVAHLRTGRDLPLAAFRDGVNRHLPEDIAVRKAEFVDADFHARYSAKGKWYCYSIFQGPVRSPLVHPFCWHIRSPLDIESMQQAAGGFRGLHDFAGFRASSCDARTTIREIFSLTVGRKEKMIYIDVKGSGFLRHMVRRIVGTLVEIGLGKRSPAEVEAMLCCGQKAPFSLTAPPQGLCLMEVWY